MIPIPGVASFALKVAPWALAGLGIWFYGHSRYNDGRDTERAKWEVAADAADKEILRLNVARVTDQLAAYKIYSEKLSAQEPIILHDRTTVERYAATPAGSAVCLDADRVRGIEGDARARGIGYPASAGPNTEPVSGITTGKEP